MPVQPIKKVLLFSTLNPYPFWAGSENLWFDFVQDERVNKQVNFQVALAESPVTKKKAVQLAAAGVKTSFYHHFNVSFAKRNLYRVRDKFSKLPHRTLPWYDEIKKGYYNLVWFNVAALADLADLSYAVELCKKQGIPYWLLLQHGYEDFFLNSEKEIATVTEVAASAKRFVFISKRNRWSLERAIGKKLTNAFHSVNAISASTIKKAADFSKKNIVSSGGTANFFNLGRFSPRDKAQHLLLEAFSDDKWKERDWQLSFIGVSGFGQTYLEKLICFYGLNPDRIKMIPHTENVLEEIVKHDVLLMPSLAEGTPFAMIESMACGRPALGTVVGGIPELITGNETGWLCRSADSAAIAEKLEEAWQQRSKWEEFGLKAQKHIAKNYNQETSFVELLKVLTEDIN